VETSNHFLACPHPTQQQVWKDLHDALHKRQLHHSVSTVFHDMFVYAGLYWGQQAYTALNFSHLPHDLKGLYCTQEGLGWKQLYYGQLVPLWIKLMNVYHPQVNVLQYFTKATTLIWQAVLKIWQIWNTHLHPGNPEQEECSYLQAAVNQIFYDIQWDPQLNALVVEHLTPEQIMN